MTCISGYFSLVILGLSGANLAQTIRTDIITILTVALIVFRSTSVSLFPVVFIFRAIPQGYDYLLLLHSYCGSGMSTLRTTKKKLQSLFHMSLGIGVISITFPLQLSIIRLMSKIKDLNIDNLSYIASFGTLGTHKHYSLKASKGKSKSK